MFQEGYDVLYGYYQEEIESKVKKSSYDSTKGIIYRLRKTRVQKIRVLVVISFSTSPLLFYGDNLRFKISRNLFSSKQKVYL